MGGGSYLAGLSPDSGGAATGDALMVAYLAAAYIPLWPYAVLPLMWPALGASLACTMTALFALGLAKSTSRASRADGESYRYC